MCSQYYNYLDILKIYRSSETEIFFRFECYYLIYLNGTIFKRTKNLCLNLTNVSVRQLVCFSTSCLYVGQNRNVYNITI